jgi:hypothetical protein
MSDREGEAVRKRAGMVMRVKRQEAKDKTRGI